MSSKKILSISIGLTMVAFAPTGVSFASETSRDTQPLPVISRNDDLITPSAGQTIYKTNVRYATEKGAFRRVSNYVTNSKGQSISISSNDTVSYSRVISGSVYGISVSSNKTISSSTGYTINTSSPGTWYLAVRPTYKVEYGTRNVQSGHSGAVSKNSYRVAVPVSLEYRLLKR